MVAWKDVNACETPRCESACVGWPQRHHSEYMALDPSQVLVSGLDHLLDSPRSAGAKERSGQIGGNSRTQPIGVMFGQKEGSVEIFKHNRCHGGSESGRCLVAVGAHCVRRSPERMAGDLPAGVLLDAIPWGKMAWLHAVRVGREPHGGGGKTFGNCRAPDKK